MLGYSPRVDVGSFDAFAIDDDEELPSVLDDALLEGMSDRSYFLLVTDCTVKLISRARITCAARDRSRGKMGVMSVRSKNRLLYRANLIDWSACGRTSFLTLTFPDDKWPVRSSRRTMFRSRFMRDLEKHTSRPQASLWRQEWEVRKSGSRKGTYASHFHIILPDSPWIDKYWIKETWMKCIGESTNADTDIVEIDEPAGVIKYLASYLSCISSLDIVPYLNTDAEFGRPWGFTREESIPKLPFRIVRPVTDGELHMLRNLVKGIRPKYDPKVDGGFTLLGEYYSAAAMKIMQMPY